MRSDYFIDTGILVRFRDISEPIKQKQAAEWLSVLWREHSGKISFQVLNEYYLAVTQKMKPGMDHKTAQTDVTNLMAWKPVVVDQLVIEKGWSIQDRYGFFWRDSLTIASAQKANSSVLLSENFQHERNIGGLTIINPFLSSQKIVSSRYKI